jgi:hypothetical protein
MSRIEEILTDDTRQAVAPFLWVHGSTDGEARLREMVGHIQESGIDALCVEARPHDDFNGEGWWRDLGVILDECKARGMRMWLLDDSHFPTGFANGEVKRSHPELCKKYLRLSTFDVMGPLEGAELNLTYQLMMTDPKAQILGVWAIRRNEPDEPDASEAIDLTAGVHRRADYMTDRPMFDAIGNPTGMNEPERAVVDVNLPAGKWYVCVLTVGFKGGEKETEGYLNPIDPAATQVLLDTVYQPVYEHFGTDFGGTFQGFFSDEPRFGNIHGSESASIGRNPQMPLPWRDDLAALLAQRLAGTKLAGLDEQTIMPYLPLLFFGDSEDAHVLRASYMDLVSQLYSQNFDGVIADWCHTHGVRHIGHTIEDNHAVARLGYGAGHFFRAMAHADMAGIDVVMQQLQPGYDQGLFRAFHKPGWEMEFFDHALGKLGGSLAHLDAKKNGLCMAEVFGAFGWAGGNRLDKWLVDYMLVRGVNRFVPHAFTAKDFPDSDCPAHFWAGGHNPQYPEFAQLMAYTQRIGGLLAGGEYAPAVAVWFPAEGEWSGDYMSLEVPAARLDRAQVEYDFVSSDYLDGAAVTADGRAQLGAEKVRGIVMPWVQAVPRATLEAVLRLAQGGVPVWFVDALPERTTDGLDASELLAAIAAEKNVRVVALDGLVEAVVAAGLRELAPSCEQPWLRTYHYLRPADGADVYLLVNEHPNKRVTCTLAGGAQGHTYTYDAFNNTLVEDPAAFDLDLAPYGSRVVVVTREAVAGALPTPAGFAVEKSLELGACKVSLASHESLCQEWSKPVALDHATYISGMPGRESFAGRIRYEWDVELDAAPARARLVLLGVREGARVTVNGVECGVKIVPDYVFDLRDCLRAGANHVMVEVNTTLSRAIDDFVGQFLPLEPTGLTGATLEIGA